MCGSWKNENYGRVCTIIKAVDFWKIKGDW